LCQCPCSGDHTFPSGTGPGGCGKGGPLCCCVGAASCQCPCSGDQTLPGGTGPGGWGVNVRLCVVRLSEELSDIITTNEITTTAVKKITGVVESGPPLDFFP